MMTRKEIHRFTLRLPLPLFEEIRAEALLKGLTANAYILVIINEYYQQNEAIKNRGKR